MPHFRIFILICILTNLNYLSFSRKTVAVSKFLNTNKNQQSTGDYIQRSIAYYLTGTKDFYSIDVQNINKYLQYNTTNNKKISGFFNSSLVISGTYTDINGTISINTSIYQRKTETIDYISVQGKSGVDLFDTIEILTFDIAKRISGENIKFGRLLVKSLNNNSLYVNGRKIKNTDNEIELGYGSHLIQVRNNTNQIKYENTIIINSDSQYIIEIPDLDFRKQNDTPQLTLKLSNQYYYIKSNNNVSLPYTHKLTKKGHYKLDAYLGKTNYKYRTLLFHSTIFYSDNRQDIIKNLPTSVDNSLYFMAAVPGLYQFYSKEYLKGSLITSFFFTGVTLAILSPILWNNYYYYTIKPYEDNLEQEIDATSQINNNIKALKPPWEKPKYTPEETEQADNDYDTTTLDQLYENGQILYLSFLVAGLITLSISWITSIIDSSISIYQTNKLLKSASSTSPLKIKFDVRFIS